VILRDHTTPPSVRLQQLLCLALLACSALGRGGANEPETTLPESRECFRKMRKVFEALQTYRRERDGRYPNTLAELIDATIVSPEDLICPSALRILPGSSRPGGTWTSIGASRDSELSYQYELSHSPVEPRLLEKGTNATWRQVKMEMALRPGWTDVPVLRCERHSGEGERLNVSFAGITYTSRLKWEERFVDSVPLTYRAPYLVLKRSVPPFVSEGDEGENVRGGVDLGSVCNALPDDPWWWGHIVGPHNESTATLEALVRKKVLHATHNGTLAFDVRYLVQVQGAMVGEKEFQRGFTKRCFPVEKVISISQKASEVHVLCGTVWHAPAGEVVGQITWTNSEGESSVISLVMGENIGCFRGKLGEEEGPDPFWEAEFNNSRMRVFLVSWTSPWPEQEIQSMTLAASPDSVASPFIVGATSR
jgi:hypothetical protein